MKAADVAAVAAPVVGEDWVIVVAVTMSAKVHVPLFDAVSESVPVTVYVPTAKGPLVVTAPPEDTMSWVNGPEWVSA